MKLLNQKSFLQWGAFWLAVIGGLTLLPVRSIPLPWGLIHTYWPKFSIYYYSLKNPVGNILLFLPPGFMTAKLLLYHRQTIFRAVVLSVGLGFLLSCGIELSQRFIPSRYPCAEDVMLNAIGAAAGALAVLLFRLRKRFSFRGLKVSNLPSAKLSGF